MILARRGTAVFTMFKPFNALFNRWERSYRLLKVVTPRPAGFRLHDPLRLPAGADGRSHAFNDERPAAPAHQPLLFGQPGIDHIHSNSKLSELTRDWLFIISRSQTGSLILQSLACEHRPWSKPQMEMLRSEEHTSELQ